MVPGFAQVIKAGAGDTTSSMTETTSSMTETGAKGHKRSKAGPRLAASASTLDPLPCCGDRQRRPLLDGPGYRHLVARGGKRQT